MASTLAEAKDAVLARVREAGDAGALVQAINDAVGPLAWSAICALIEEGRIRVVDGERLVLTAAQREIDELAGGYSAARIRELEGAEGNVSFWLDKTISAREDADAWREVALSLPLAPKSGEDSAGSGNDIKGRPRAYSAELGRRLNLLAQSVRSCGVEGAPPQREAYADALAAASWMASYGKPSPARTTARVLLGKSDGAVVLVLGFTSDGMLLAEAPGLGRLRFGRDGAAVNAPTVRLHPDDLAALRGESAPALASAQVEG